jgi:hypothetical protein
MTEPAITARFILDDQGRPRFEESPDGLRHYELALEVKNAPAEAYGATFELDPTYYDPVRSVRPDETGALRLETTSYGDFVLTAQLNAKSPALPLRTSLARALRQSHPNPDAAVQRALRDIADH